MSEETVKYIISLCENLGEDLEYLLKGASIEVLHSDDDLLGKKIVGIITENEENWSELDEKFHITDLKLSLISLEEVKNLEEFYRHGGRIILREKLLSINICREIFKRHLGLPSSIRLEGSYGAFLDQFRSFKLLGHLETGHYSDIIVKDAHLCDINTVSLRNFFIHMQTYIAYLHSSGVSSYPVDIDYGYNSDCYVVQMHFPVVNFVLDYLLESMRGDGKNPSTHLFQDSLKQVPLIEVTYLEDASRVLISAIWIKNKNLIDIYSKNIIFTNLKSFAQISRRWKGFKKHPEIVTHTENRTNLHELEKKELYGKGLSLLDLTPPEGEPALKKFDSLHRLVEFAMSSFKSSGRDDLKELTENDLKNLLQGFPNRKILEELKKDEYLMILDFLKDDDFLENMQGVYKKKMEELDSEENSRQDFLTTLKRNINELSFDEIEEFTATKGTFDLQDEVHYVKGESPENEGRPIRVKNALIEKMEDGTLIQRYEDEEGHIIEILVEEGQLKAAGFEEEDLEALSSGRPLKLPGTPNPISLKKGKEDDYFIVKGKKDWTDDVIKVKGWSEGDIGEDVVRVKGSVIEKDHEGRITQRFYNEKDEIVEEEISEEQLFEAGFEPDDLEALKNGEALELPSEENKQGTMKKEGGLLKSSSSTRKVKKKKEWESDCIRVRGHAEKGEDHGGFTRVKGSKEVLDDGMIVIKGGPSEDLGKRAIKLKTLNQSLDKGTWDNKKNEIIKKIELKVLNNTTDIKSLENAQSEISKLLAEELELGEEFASSITAGVVEKTAISYVEDNKYKNTFEVAKNSSSISEEGEKDLENEIAKRDSQIKRMMGLITNMKKKIKKDEDQPSPLQETSSSFSFEKENDSYSTESLRENIEILREELKKTTRKSDQRAEEIGDLKKKSVIPFGEMKALKSEAQSLEAQLERSQKHVSQLSEKFSAQAKSNEVKSIEMLEKLKEENQKLKESMKKSMGDIQAMRQAEIDSKHTSVELKKKIEQISKGPVSQGSEEVLKKRELEITSLKEASLHAGATQKEFLLDKKRLEHKLKTTEAKLKQAEEKAKKLSGNGSGPSSKDPRVKQLESLNAKLGEREKKALLDLNNKKKEMIKFKQEKQALENQVEVLERKLTQAKKAG